MARKKNPSSPITSGKIIGRIHAGIADEQAAPEPPGVQVRLDLGDSADVGGIARQHPGAHRHAITGDRHGDDHLRLMIPAFLAVTPPAQGREQPPTPFLLDLIGFVDLEIGRGGVIED